MSGKQIKIVLIDNHPLFREGLIRILQAEPSFAIVADGDEKMKLVEVVKRYQPTILLIDIQVIYAKKLNVKTDILSNSPETKVIVLSMNNEGKDVTDVIKMGVHGYLLKDMDVNTFMEAIYTISEGSYQIHAKLSHHLIEEYLKLIANLSGEEVTKEKQLEKPLHIYTKRECEVLQLLANGKSNRDIALALAISEKTVKNHISSIFKKMKVNDRTQAVVTAIRNNWVEI